MRKILLCIALIAAGAKAGETRIGQAVPALHIGPVLSGSPQGPVAGRTLLIEFWEPWCGPCRAAIPHLNQLADRFGDRIDFLSLSSESADTVRAFLQEHPIHGIVALDPHHVNCDLFDLTRGMPETILIDNSGVLQAVTQPAAVTAEVLEALLAHQSLRLEHPDWRILERTALIPGAKVADADTIARVIVRRVNRPGDTVSTTDQYESQGSGLKDLLAYAYGIPALRIEIPTYLSDEVYAVQAWVPPRHPETLKPLMRAALSAGACLRIRREERLTDVLVLTGMPGNLRVSSSSALSQGGSPRSGEISGDLTAEDLRRYLEMAIRKTVLLDNAPAQRFSLQLHWDPDKSGDLASALRNQLGVELVPGKRRVPFLVVDSADAVNRADDGADQ